MWASPIKMFQTQMQIEYENEVMKAVQKVGFDIDKEELIKALQYDRNQYNKGYADAVDDIAKAFAEKIICEGCSYCTICYELEKYHTCSEYMKFMEIAESMKRR